MFHSTARSVSKGHVFNMPHDNVRACEDVFGKLQDNHMMSPTLVKMNRTSPWSPCSAAIITEFLDSGHGGFLCSQLEAKLENRLTKKIYCSSGD